MILNRVRGLFVVFVFQSLSFTSFSFAEQLSLPANDLIAPEVSHQAVTDTLEEGASLQLRATVTDNVGVKSVTLYYRVTGSDNYKSVNMLRIENSNDYAVTLGKQDLVVPGIEYYIQAFDVAGNSLLHGYSFSPLKVSVTSHLANSQAQVKSDDSLKSTTSQPRKKKTKNWIWIGLGALALGTIAAVAGGGGGGDNPQSVEPNTTITVGAPVPSNNN
jgi:hypothetical protein